MAPFGQGVATPMSKIDQYGKTKVVKAYETYLL